MTILQFHAAAGQAQPQPGQPIEDWTCTEWRLSHARSGADTTIVREIDDQDVVELELDDGSVLFMASDQLESYGFRPSRSGGPIEIRPVLAPPDQSRGDRGGAWTLRALRLWRNPAGAAMKTLASTLQDRALGQRLGWYRFGDQAVAIEALPQLPPASAPVLLMIHGTYSSTPGSFGDLLQGATMQQLRTLYGDRLYGFEHRSLTDSPLDNALALAEGLPENLTADVITHSRGGLVAELLIRASESGEGGLADEDFALLERLPEATVRDAMIRGLKELRDVVKRKNLRVRRIVRTAAPMRGTTLLSGRLDRWSTVSFNLISKGLGLAGQVSAAQIVQAAKALMLELTRQRADASVLPGLEAMRPESPWVALLNPPEGQVKVPTFVIAGDYQGKGLLSWLTDRFSDTFYGGANDFVVNTASMTGGAHRVAGLRYVLFRDRDTHHLNYFSREPVQRRILDALENGENAAGFEIRERESSVIARGGRKPKPKPNAPIALVLPGITGSHLEVGRDRIWMQPHELLFGNLRQLHIEAENVEPDGWIDRYYERFSDFLTSSHEVRPFAYDWRLSIADSGAQFANVLGEALDAAEQRRQPVHIFAHSMGGLVARWALGLDGLWERLSRNSGSRLLMLGTPNRGSHAIPWLLMGREKTLRLLQRVDWRHDAGELVALFSRFPGILQLMPYDGAAGGDFFRAEYWQRVRTALGADWPIPHAEALAASKDVLDRLNREPLAGKPVIYVAGHASKEPTLSGIRLEPAPATDLDPDGDGRVLWSTGIPEGFKAWYANVAHGDLLRHARAFEAYRELATHGFTGSTHLSQTPPTPPAPGSLARGAAGAAGEERDSLVLYPTAEEVLAAAMGGEMADAVESAPPSHPVRVKVIHGNIATARGAVVVGHYEDDEELAGAPRSLDCLIGGGLADALALDCLPGRPGEVLVVRGDPRAGRLDAIVIGLGRVGSLDVGTLQKGFAKALREYALQSRWSEPGDSPPIDSAPARADAGPVLLDLATVLVGSGSFGLGIDAVAASLVRAIEDVQQSLLELPDRAGSKVLIGSLRIYEMDRARAERATLALARLASERQVAHVEFDGRVHAGEHGLQTYLGDVMPASDALRVHIKAPNGLDGGLDFTVISQSARSDFIREPQQGAFVSGMLRLALGSTADQSGLSRALFELLTPNSYKPLIGNLESIVLNVDETAATIPWEWMRDGDPRQRPLATRVRMVRQLVRSPGESAPRARMTHALVIGDTDTGLSKYPRLAGARREMTLVCARLRDHFEDVEGVEGIKGLEMLTRLLTREIGLLHIAAHGDWVELPGTPDGSGGSAYHSGVVLDDGLLLTSHQIAKLPHVPEFVFLNCCHLGDASRDPARSRWSELAASLAIAFIDRGAKAVVACGWAVDDAAAAHFAEAFYGSLLSGSDLAAAALIARRSTFERFPAHNTWAAYQVYGDPFYRPRLDRQGGGPTREAQAPILTTLTAVDAIHALLGRFRVEERCLGSDHATDAAASATRALESLQERLHPLLLDEAEVRGALGRAYLAVGDRSSAIAHWRAALACPVGAVPLSDIEQLANTETRHAAATLHRAVGECGDVPPTGKPELLAACQSAETLVDKGEERIQSLLKASGETLERLCLLGSAKKRQAWISAIRQRVGDSEPSDPMVYLGEAVNAYDVAAKLARAQNDEQDHYPANNLVQLRWLEALLQGKTIGPGLMSELRALAEAAERNAARRAVEGGDFWDHAAAVDAAFSKALTRFEITRARSPGESAAISQQLLTALRAPRNEIRRRFGDSSRNASPREQLQLFCALLCWGARSGVAHAESLEEWRRVFEAVLATLEGTPRPPSAPDRHTGGSDAAISPAMGGEPDPDASSSAAAKPAKATGSRSATTARKKAARGQSVKPVPPAKTPASKTSAPNRRSRKR